MDMKTEAVRGNFFRENLNNSIREYIDEIKELYLADTIPWVIGYSGGKDSTAITQLVWQALLEIPESDRIKDIHIISTDTLVENPIVANWVIESHNAMNIMIDTQKLPIITHLLEPDINSTFWVNLIGKGYPAPRNNFRWCTDRLKIKPSNTFMRELVNKHGEVILLLGMRTAESSNRAKSMKRYEAKKVRDNLNPSGSLPNCLVYPLIKDWSNDDVWLYLLQYKNPWGYNNKDLLSMYSGATADGECPLVVDTSTPSCGNSRFGCWVCTLVEEDKSMAAMISNDTEKEWMSPLLDFRNNLDFRSESERKRDRNRRDFRRMSGVVVPSKKGDYVPGPYTQSARIELLTELLKIQKVMKDMAPASMKDYNIISFKELERIREIWVYEKNEIEDILPKIYQEINGLPFPSNDSHVDTSFSKKDFDILEELSENRQQYELIRNLLAIETKFKNQLRRSGIFDEIKSTFKKHSIHSQEEASTIASRKHEYQNAIAAIEESDFSRINELGFGNDI